jgi:ribokinase
MDAHGGKGANQAVAAARASGGTVPVKMIGALGDDAYGQSAAQNFALNGVIAECAILPDCATGTAFITLSSDGENAITVVPGANNLLDGTHASPETLQNTSVLLCQGEVRLAETGRVISAYRDARSGGLTILNLAPVPQDGDVNLLGQILMACDILIVNEREADAVLKRLTPVGRANLSTLAAEFDCHIIITRGPDGAELIAPAGATVHAPSPNIDPVDTTGAGDTCCGVFAALLAEGWEMEPALTKACEAAAKACGAVGAQTGMPLRNDLLKELDLA